MTSPVFPKIVMGTVRTVKPNRSTGFSDRREREPQANQSSHWPEQTFEDHGVTISTEGHKGQGREDFSRAKTKGLGFTFPGAAGK